MPEAYPAETVSWINVEPLNRREKIARWWVEDIRQQHTYASKRQRSQEFMTAIEFGAVGGLACEALRSALMRQKAHKESGAASIEFPRATPTGTEYFGSILIPSQPLDITFTEHGIASHSDEDY